MAGKLFKYDCYDLRKFDPRYINTFIDIGANIGSVSIMARILCPFSRILAFEPCIETYEWLVSAMRSWKVECYNKALGPNVPMFISRGHISGVHKFLVEEEVKRYRGKREYSVSSIMLPDIIEKYNINKDLPFILKVDCEGGEKYLRNKESIDIIKQSTQTMIEIHIPFGGSSQEFELFFKEFVETHNQYYGEWEGDRYNRRYVFKSFTGTICNSKKITVVLISKEYENFMHNKKQGYTKLA